MPTCVDPDADAATTQYPYTVQTTVDATGGSFTDTCDADGNLIEYQCELGCYGAVPVTGSSAPIPKIIGVPCLMEPTGQVLSTTVDCGGECVDGACVVHCPEPGDQILYVAQDGDVITLENVTKTRTYSCTVIFDRADDGYDCVATAHLGATTEVYSLGLSSLLCAGAELGNIGTDDPNNELMQECTYGCTTVM